MRRFLIIIGLVGLASCKPDVDLGPLDSPLGNWKEIISEYYFNGENVYEAPNCTYSCISFYKDSLCCIEGLKGAFTWTYSSDSLVVDTTIWKVTELTGRIMTLDYLGIIEKEDTAVDAVSENDNQDTTTDDNPTPTVPATVTYNGQTIETDGKKHWYVNAEGKSVTCFPLDGTSEDGSETVICWWDTRSDSYKPF